MKNLFLYLFIVLVPLTLTAQPDCSVTSVGLIPINDLGAGTYNGWTGGLYPNASNYMPPLHKNAGLAIASQVQPLDGNGNADTVNGKIVWLSIGMSNTTQETQAFIPLADNLPNKNPFLKLVDGAQGGKPAREISNPTLPEYTQFWNEVDQRLLQAGVTAQQVQVIWFKTDNPAGNPVPTPLQEHYDSLLIQSKRIMHEIKTRFPNSKLCYVASRIYAGYASTNLNPEPYAYRNGWTMKKLIEDQINGDTALQYSGPGANSPWLSWGIYQWADGTVPRSDGLTWNCPGDYQNDGTHPSPAGCLKVANMLLDFFQNDSTACPWFLSNCSITTGVNETNINNTIRVYPIPVSSDITIESGKPLFNAEVAVFNSIGQQILRVSNFSGNSVSLDLSSYPGQLLHLKIQSQGLFFTKKILKE